MIIAHYTGGGITIAMDSKKYKYSLNDEPESFRELGDIDSCFAHSLLNSLLDIVSFINGLFLQLWNAVTTNNAVLHEIGEGLALPYTTVEKAILLLNVVHRHLAKRPDELLN
jgi:hypothetical protein